MRACSFKTAGKRNALIKRIVWGLDVLFCLCCMIYSLCISEYSQAAGCAATILLVCLPGLFERLAKRPLNPLLYFCCSLYALGPMIGEVFLLYYVTPWWDKLLHFIGGIVFAWAGVILLNLFNRKNTAVACAVFALCFSVAVSAVWEFCEFGMDTLIGTDAQHDTVIFSIHSYLLGDRINEVSSIEDIQKTVINGTEIDGYLDIGLYDTMTDMLFESLGALIFSAGFLLAGRTGKKKTESSPGPSGEAAKD